MLSHCSTGELGTTEGGTVSRLVYQLLNEMEGLDICYFRSPPAFDGSGRRPNGRQAQKMRAWLVGYSLRTPSSPRSSQAGEHERRIRPNGKLCCSLPFCPQTFGYADTGWCPVLTALDL